MAYCLVLEISILFFRERTNNNLMIIEQVILLLHDPTNIAISSHLIHIFLYISYIFIYIYIHINICIYFIISLLWIYPISNGNEKFITFIMFSYVDHMLVFLRNFCSFFTNSWKYLLFLFSYIFYSIHVWYQMNSMHIIFSCKQFFFF